MYFFMANFTDRFNIQPMFRCITRMMIVLCLAITQYAFQFRWFWKSIISDCVRNSIFCFKSFWVFFVIFFRRNCTNLFTFLCFIVTSLMFSVLWSFSIKTIARFAIRLQFIFTGIESTYTKFFCRFDCLAVSAIFRYNLVSHVRSFSTSLVKAAVGIRPVCGLFYSTMAKGGCQ